MGRNGCGYMASALARFGAIFRMRVRLGSSAKFQIRDIKFWGRGMRGWFLGMLVGVSCVLQAGAAHADRNDISLRGLGRPQSSLLSDPAVARYRALTSELAVAMAPRILAPAETAGPAGFNFAIATSFTNIRSGASHWQGQPGFPVLEGGDRFGVPGALMTPTLHLRKGLPLSTEVALTTTFLAQSTMVMLGGEVKIAIHEGHFRWVPTMSIRIAASHLLGSRDIDMVVAEPDFIMSLPIGLGGTVVLTPFVSGGVLLTHVNSEILDDTPHRVSDSRDQQGGLFGSLYTFPTLNWVDNRIARYTVGARLRIAFVDFLYQMDMGVLSFDKTTLFSHTVQIGWAL